MTYNSPIRQTVGKTLSQTWTLSLSVFATQLNNMTRAIKVCIFRLGFLVRRYFMTLNFLLNKKLLVWVKTLDLAILGLANNFLVGTIKLLTVLQDSTIRPQTRFVPKYDWITSTCPENYVHESSSMRIMKLLVNSIIYNSSSF